MKETVRGAVPDVGVPANAAVGAEAPPIIEAPKIPNSGSLKATASIQPSLMAVAVLFSVQTVRETV